MSKTKQAVAALDESIALHHKMIETMTNLKRALLVAELLGVAPKDVDGPIKFWTYSIRSGAYSFRPWLDTVLRARIGDGEDKEFPLKDVPMELWPEEIRAAYERHKRTLARRRT